MAFAITHPDRTHGRHAAATREAVTARRAAVRPVGAAVAGTGAVLVGIWGAIAGYIGPYFGYHPTAGTAWTWSAQNGLLHLAPGAVAVLAGMLILSAGPARGGARRLTVAVPALLLLAAGAWFVIGPVAWPMFGTGAAFAAAGRAGTRLLDQAGSSLAPGLALAMFGGMAVKASMIRRREVVLPDPAPMTGPVTEAAPVSSATEETVS